MTQVKDQIHKRSAGIILLAATLWGTSFPVIEFGIDYINAYHFAFFRFAIASLILTLFLRYQGKPFPKELLRNKLVLALGLTNAVGFFLQYAGMTLTTAINTALLVNSNFVLVIIASAYVFKEKIAPIVGVSLVACEFGVLLLTTGGELDSLSSDSFFGDVLVFLAGIAWVGYIIVNKMAVSEDKKGEALDVDSLMTAVMVMTMVFIALPAFAFGGFDISRDPVGWSTVLYISLFCTAMPFLLYSHGLKKVGAGASMLMLLWEVVVAAIISVLFLKEGLGAVNMVGGLLILAGIAMVALKR